MLTKLRLERFKNFADAELRLGPLTTLIGTNASGKSNLRDALRFLHGIARGYTLADIMGERWGEGGVLQWRGIRGGALEVAFHGATAFALTVSFEGTGLEDSPASSPSEGVYRIEVESGRNGRPRVIRESLSRGSEIIFDTRPPYLGESQRLEPELTIWLPEASQWKKAERTFTPYEPVLSQLAERFGPQDRRKRKTWAWTASAMAAFGSMRFLDLNPEAMRLPSLPGQIVLGDRGENLSSVLQAIYEDEPRRQALIEWVHELTPMDVVDFAFPADQAGRVLVSLVEAGGQSTSAYSASDGTLRFLAVLAALLGPEPAQLYFFEELENGLHPARLHLLLDMIEKRVARRDIQVVATTHSTQLLRLLSPESRQYTSLCYRLAGRTESSIQRVLDLPPAALDVLNQKDLGSLLAGGWFENVMSFMQDEEG